MVNPQKVSELFMFAGEAMTRLGQLTHSLPFEGQFDDSKSKWTGTEVEMLSSAIRHFSLELNAIATIIERRTAEQLKSQLMHEFYKKDSLVHANTVHSESTYQASTNIIEDIVDQSEEVVTNDVNLYMSTPDHQLNIMQFDEKEKSSLR